MSIPQERQNISASGFCQALALLMLLAALCAAAADGQGSTGSSSTTSGSFEGWTGWEQLRAEIPEFYSLSMTLIHGFCQSGYIELSVASVATRCSPAA
jgi:hypothetical protein